METFVIYTPCSASNIGPGFDALGVALSLYLELHVAVNHEDLQSQYPLNCKITYEGVDQESGFIDFDPRHNIITRTALYILQCHGQPFFPRVTKVHIKNPIPLRKGLGSSGAAVVAGAFLGRKLGGLGHISDERLHDFCLMIGT